MTIYESVTERILEQLGKGVIPWRKEWKYSGPVGLPYNRLSGKPYRGINVLLLLSAGFTDARWLTYKQAQELGGNVRRGEKGTRIVFWNLFSKVEKADSGELTEEKIPFMREYTVFNWEQVDGLTAELPFTDADFEPIPAAQSLTDEYLTRAGIELRHGGGQAYYSPRLDYIQMPDKVSFYSMDAYYATLFHESGHSTGHKTRLARDLENGGGFGSADYSKEELVAEFTAAFLCAQTGISNERLEVNQAAYIQSWMKAFKNDPKMLVSAAQKAQRAADFIQNKTFAEQEAAAA